MNELIKISSNENDEQVVSARELHKGIEVKTRFSLWWEQNSKFLIENEDFTSVVSTTVVNNGARRQLQDYALTIDTAKHLAMQSQTEKGREYRNYFIQVEKAWNSPDMVMKRALQIADKRVLALESQNEEMKPKALFADSVASSHTSILVGELAKILRSNGVNIGANRLFEWLRNNGYLIKRNGSDRNMPTQKSMDLGLFEIKEGTRLHADGSIAVTKTPKVTGKGQIYFVNKFLQEVA
ncbi:MAG: phage antirepressor KilAC domain-containing protein [Lactococcus lactis]|jgi:anti-repressor protein|uniref:phage antirepressor KilAC domain-containing protein n=1 Tax=Lactococcus lactis TaxID=1358 RepID=UPI00265287A2|nr:phage antirepressor KilAC domain-containing protein [Lactococcus lactis]MDN6244764.1 phage antirepressor KilAC domain-containing protein [Tetragenococcus koreensis]MDN5615233.1 phage antirepressor KilAC domain-containing protein [Lactococcus lactis]MDN5982156.1 phage antirepressor KilAC domain-containing protein [Lactococcus lactis]MDN5995018.1 phage antirepressor KilAC domain-containing protein [Lactococcus lactis]